MPGRNMRLKMKGGVISQDDMSSPHGMEGGRRHHRRMFAKQSMDIVLLDADKKPVIGDVDSSRETRLIPVMHQDKIVGWLGMTRRENPADDEESLFFQRQSRIFLMIALAMTLVSVIVAVWTAYYLERPIRVLTKGTRDLAAGQFKTRIPVASGDELGQLSRDFNTLAATLEENEKDRKKWVQDIAHELRTPLTLLSGELEAVEDGVRELNEETLLRLKGDIHHLIRLVNDLNELSKTGAGALSYKKTVMDLIPLIRRSSDRFKGAFEEADIVFEDKTDQENPAMILADEERLGQLFGNILQNSLDYTDSGGRIRVRTERLPGRIAVHIEDSAPGVPQDALNRLFDRLYQIGRAHV
jgi:two-component system sensor histidine kinase BaeS